MSHVTRFVVTLAWLTLGGTVAALVLELPRITWLFWISCGVFVYAGGCWLLATTCPNQAKALCSLGDMAPARPAESPRQRGVAIYEGDVIFFGSHESSAGAPEPGLDWLNKRSKQIPVRFGGECSPYPSDGC